MRERDSEREREKERERERERERECQDDMICIDLLDVVAGVDL